MNFSSSPSCNFPFPISTRVVMAPLTRCRALLPDYVPNAYLASKYYGQRAKGGGKLIISEATCISRQGRGFKRTPGIYTQAQAQEWSKIVDSVKTAGSFFFMQLWHVGRASHESFHGTVEEPLDCVVSCTETPIDSSDKVFLCSTENDGLVSYSKPRKLTSNETLTNIIPAYERAASLAQDAGFDGVELHAANGYLLQQFLEDGVNEMAADDGGFGGSIENRCRLVLILIDRLLGVWGPGKVGIRLSPFSKSNNVFDSNPLALYDYLLSELNKRPLAYIHMVEPQVMGGRDIIDDVVSRYSPEVQEAIKIRMGGYPRVSNAVIFRSQCPNLLFIVAGGLTRDLALELLSQGHADLVAFGRFFISNPDLPERLQQNHPLTPYDRRFFYDGEEKGYIDYDFFKQ